MSASAKAERPAPYSSIGVEVASLPARNLSRRLAMRLATVATTIDATITTSDIQVEISGAHAMDSPPLMNGSSLTCMACRISLTPMKARMVDSQ